MHTKVRRPRRKLWLAAIVVSFLLFIVFAGYVFFQNITKGTGSDILTSFLTLPDYGISQTNNRTNILLLGRGGVFNDTPDLTDTLMLASVRLGENPDVTLISVPRDIWVQSLAVKINHIYKIGRERGTIESFSLPKQEIEAVLGVPVHYVAVIDYGGFIRLIDALGGIDVQIENSFTDFKFPIIGKENDECNGDKTFACRYETVTFAKGPEHMDGARALKYARSRHSLDPLEGSDLARARRQQILLSAVKDKALSPATLTSYTTLVKVRDIALESIETDIAIEEAAVLARTALKVTQSINSFVLPESFLYSPPLLATYGRQFVFLPVGGNWERVHQWVNEVLGLIVETSPS